MMSDDVDMIDPLGSSNDVTAPSSSSANNRRYNEAEERKGLLDHAGSSSDDDDFFLHGPKVHSGKLGGLKSQVEEVTNTMRDNVGKLMERGERLDDLRERSDHLSGLSTEFSSSAGRLRRKMWWENTKAKIVAGASTAVVLIIIIIISFW